MWRSLSSSMPKLEPLKKNNVELVRAHHDLSDDETCSTASTDEALECPICCESFNIVENVPYVLWCGHTLCKNCVLGLKWAALKVYSQRIQIPLFVSCPWCNLLTFRLIYKGNLTFPSKNFFLLWMVEGRNSDRAKSPPSIFRDHQQVWSPRCTSVIGNDSSNPIQRRMHRLGLSSSSNGSDHHSDGPPPLSQGISFHKSLDFFIHTALKLPLIILLLILVFALPSSAAILTLFMVITILLALPAFLVLYFAYPALSWLAREIAS